MASRREHIALEVVRHFKRAQLSAWVGDEQTAEREYGKCGQAIWHFRGGELRRRYEGERPDELAALDEMRKIAPRKMDERISRVEKKEVTALSSRIGGMTYTLIPHGSSRAEFRALIDLPPSLLRQAAPTKDKENQADHRTWRWIDVNSENGFTGTFLLSFADGALFAQVTSHEFLNDLEAVSRLRESLAQAVVERLQLNMGRG